MHNPVNISETVPLHPAPCKWAGCAGCGFSLDQAVARPRPPQSPAPLLTRAVCSATSQPRPQDRGLLPPAHPGPEGHRTAAMAVAAPETWLPETLTASARSRFAVCPARRGPGCRARPARVPTVPLPAAAGPRVSPAESSQGRLRAAGLSRSPRLTGQKRPSSSAEHRATCSAAQPDGPA